MPLPRKTPAPATQAAAPVSRAAAARAEPAAPPPQPAAESIGGSTDFFAGRTGFQHVPTSFKRTEMSMSDTFTIREDGEAAVVRFMTPEPTAIDAHSIKVGRGPKDYRPIVCPEMNPAHKGKCPALSDKPRDRGMHVPSYTGLLQVLDMRVQLVRPHPTEPGEDGKKKEYAYSLANFAYIPSPNHQDYPLAVNGDERPGVWPEQKGPRVKVWQASGRSVRGLQTYRKTLAMVCVNCVTADKPSTKIRLANGVRSCACGNPKPADITDVYTRITRTGKGTDTLYSFAVDETYGWGPIISDENGKPFELLDYAKVVPIPSPEDVANMMYKGA